MVKIERRTSKMTVDFRRGLGSHTHFITIPVCVCVGACMCVLACVHAGMHKLSKSPLLLCIPCKVAVLSLDLSSSRWQHIPLSQVRVQSLENTELLLRL